MKTISPGLFAVLLVIQPSIWIFEIIQLSFSYPKFSLKFKSSDCAFVLQMIPYPVQGVVSVVMADFGAVFFIFITKLIRSL